MCKSRERRERLFTDVGGANWKGNIHWRKSKGPGIATAHWLSPGSLPMAELFLGNEKALLYPAEVAKVSRQEGRKLSYFYLQMT